MIRLFKRRFLICFLFLFSFLWISGSPSVKAEVINAVQVSPISQTVKVGEEVRVDVDIAEATGLFGFQFNVVFDPELLSFSRVSHGSFLGSSDNVFWVSERVSNGAVRNISAVRIGTTEEVSGSGTLASLFFEAIAEGESDILLDNVILGDVSEQTVASVLRNGSVTVQSAENLEPCVFSLSNQVSHGGNASAQIVCNEDGTRCSWVNTNMVSVSEGEAYLLSGWIKTLNVEGMAYLQANFYDSDLTAVSSFRTEGVWLTSSSLLAGDKDFIYRAATIVVPEETSFLEIELVLENKGTAWFDDVYLKKDETIPNTLQISPSSQTMSSGNKSQVDVILLNTSHLAGFQFQIAYDPEILSFYSLNHGDFLGEDAFWVEEDISESGLVKNLASVRIAEGEVSGSGKLLSLTFQSLKEGEADIAFQNLILSDADGNELAVNSQSGIILVQEDISVTPVQRPTSMPTAIVVPVPGVSPGVVPVFTPTPEPPTPTPVTGSPGTSDPVPGEGCCYGSVICGQYFNRSECESAGCFWNHLCGIENSLNELIDIAVKLMSWIPFGGVLIGTVMIIYGGILRITAGDDTKKMELSTKTIGSALIGIVLSSCIWLISQLVISFIPNLSEWIHFYP